MNNKKKVNTEIKFPGISVKKIKDGIEQFKKLAEQLAKEMQKEYLKHNQNLDENTIPSM